MLTKLAPDRPVTSVAVINKSDYPDEKVSLMVEAYRRETPAFAADWGLPICALAPYPRTHTQNVEEEAVLFLVNSGNDPDAYGWHSVLGKARYGYIDVGLALSDGEPPERVFGHEYWELCVDPDCDRWVGPYPDNTFVALEVSDGPQRFGRPTPISDPLLGTGLVNIADWVLPAWFDPQSQGPWSSQNSVPGPLRDAPGGYHLVERNGLVLARGARVKSLSRTLRRLVQRRTGRPVKLG